jgi:hypothetical protein
MAASSPRSRRFASLRASGQLQAPPLQLPVQHSALDMHAAPEAVHVQVPLGAEPEQHSVVVPTQVPAGTQQAPAPPQMLPGSHCAPVVHARPNDGLHA